MADPALTPDSGERLTCRWCGSAFDEIESRPRTLCMICSSLIEDVPQSMYYLMERLADRLEAIEAAAENIGQHYHNHEGWVVKRRG